MKFLKHFLFFVACVLTATPLYSLIYSINIKYDYKQYDYNYPFDDGSILLGVCLSVGIFIHFLLWKNNYFKRKNNIIKIVIWDNKVDLVISHFFTKFIYISINIITYRNAYNNYGPLCDYF